MTYFRSVVILNYSPSAPSTEVWLSQRANHLAQMEKDAVASLPQSPHSTPWHCHALHRLLNTPSEHTHGCRGTAPLQPLGATYYFGHKFPEVEAVFGHHGTQDLGDRFGGFGFQPHGAVNGDQVQSGYREHK